jgi:formylglycine-generating enzyme required for sulfatase activity
MVSVPSGAFTMGDRNGEPDEYPERQITISAFSIDRTEVTNAAYKLCVRAKACDAIVYLDDSELGLDDYPVVGATWDDARNFCKWVGKRLPTEAEWEYAAKGSDLRKWPWKGAFKGAAANSNGQEDEHEKTAPVTAFQEGESPHGALNMAGNAAEWVADYYDPTFYRTSKQEADPKGPENGRERVVRGGSYLSTSHQLRVSARQAKLPTETDNTVGFRCAKSGG